MANSKKVYTITFKRDADTIKLLNALFNEAKSNNASLVDPNNMNLFQAASKTTSEELSANENEKGIGERIKALLQKVPAIQFSFLSQIASQGGQYQTENKDLCDVLKDLDAVEEVTEKEEQVQEQNNEQTNNNQDNFETSTNNQQQASLGMEMVKNDKEQTKEIKSNPGGSMPPPSMPFAPEDNKEDDIPELQQAKTEEEKDNIKKEYFEKRYYLSGSRMVETLEKMDVYRSLPTDLQNFLRRSYMRCVQPSDLLNPQFLTPKGKEEFNIPGYADFNFENLHMAILGNTFVGWHIGEMSSINGAEQTPKNGSLTDPQEDLAILSLPQFGNRMPESLKERARLEGKTFIENRIKDVVASGTYTALGVISPLSDFMNTTLESYAENMENSKEGTMMKLYVRQIQGDFKEEAKNGLDSFDYKFDMSDVHWERPEERNKILKQIKSLVSQGKEINVEEAIKNISLSYVIQSQGDIDKVVELIGELRSMGTEPDIKLTVNASEETRVALLEQMRARGLRISPKDQAFLDMGNLARGAAIGTAVGMAAGAVAGVATGTAAGIATGAMAGTAMNAAMPTMTAALAISSFAETTINTITGATQKRNTISATMNQNATAQITPNQGGSPLIDPLNMLAALALEGGNGGLNLDAIGMDLENTLREIEDDITNERRYEDGDGN